MPKKSTKAVRCFECGTQAMRKIRSDCRMTDGTVIRNLLHWHCIHCGENFFEPDAMDEIRRQRAAKKVRAG